MVEEKIILIGHPFSWKNVYVEKDCGLVISRGAREQWRNLPGNHRLTLNCNRRAATANLLGMCFDRVPHQALEMASSFERLPHLFDVTYVLRIRPDYRIVS